MTPRQRLLAALRGQPVDRTPVSFYEIGGLSMDPENPDPFNIYHDPSWRPLLDLAEDQTDLIRLRSPACTPACPELRARLYRTERLETDSARITRHHLTAGSRTLTSTARRNADVDTVWTTEHLLKDEDDIRAYLSLPDEFFRQTIDCRPLEAQEQALGERGIVAVDTPDPICHVAGLMDLAFFLELALTNPPLTHALLEQAARWLQPRTEAVAQAFPGRLWRIFGPEYATPPYLPPRLFAEYVVRYTQPMVQVIRRHGGWARIHCHGRIRDVLPMIHAMGADGLDPIEPPPQGDVSLAYVRANCGRDMTLFGNLEASAIELFEPPDFERLVVQALAEGNAGTGRGFVLMPSACPYGRTITPRIMANYETMLRRARAG